MKQVETVILTLTDTSGTGDGENIEMNRIQISTNNDVTPSVLNGIKEKATELLEEYFDELKFALEDTGDADLIDEQEIHVENYKKKVFNAGDADEIQQIFSDFNTEVSTNGYELSLTYDIIYIPED